MEEKVLQNNCDKFSVVLQHLLLPPKKSDIFRTDLKSA